ncbi:nucleoside hydrolase [Artomyces pyxidatus]|uniref:Nucleoside hydrolase n=1 Tax=Artomyces pyxidatus TaxID=48021 RepID=A0ACB8T309_9AGAM|nr:nucleoside hydrolase [Artomyces pyxidatus]
MTDEYPRRPVPVIIDTDPGVDDTIAILMALASPEIEILGFVVSFGNTDVQSSYLNIFKIYQAVARHIEQYPGSRTRFPNFDTAVKPVICKGAHGPLEGELHSAQFFHGRDGLGGITEGHPDLNVDPSLISAEHPHLQVSDRPGHEVALDILRARVPREVSYIALGPLTNLAQMLRTDAACVRNRVGRVVIMGGALDVPGNTNPVAEFNFFADPYAVAEVLTPENTAFGLPLSRVLLLPLDITTPHELSFPLYASHIDTTFALDAPSEANGKAPVTHFTSAFLRRTRSVMHRYGKDAMELHDIAAVWCAIENPPVPDESDVFNLKKGWHVRRRKFAMERTGELTRGMCVVDRRDDKGAYSPGANRAHIQAELERQKIQHGPLESTAVPAQVEIEDAPPPSSEDSGGVPCIVDTPGPDVLVKLLMQRIWGKQIS